MARVRGDKRGLPLGRRLADDQILVPERQNHVDLAGFRPVNAIRDSLPQGAPGPVLLGRRQQGDGAHGISLVVFRT